MTDSQHIPWEYKQIEDDEAAVVYIFSAQFQTQDGLVDAWITYRTEEGDIVEDWMVWTKHETLRLADPNKPNAQAPYPGQLAAQVVKRYGLGTGKIVVRFQGVERPVVAYA